MERIVVGFIGIMLVLIGLGTLIDPVIHHHPVYGVDIDFSNIKWPFSILAITFGMVCLFVSNSKKFMDNCNWICPQCDKVVTLNDNGGVHHCKKCDYRLEKLQGFYERHPERK